ncbi:MAG: PAS domain S-box protein [Chloroflexaceae bacterium]|nr:PAS domain S-box protein [Chloroflexaceae bacterium]
MIVDTVFETPITLDRDQFMRQLISSLGHLNEGILGSDVAGAYIMNVGLSMGAAIEAQYKQFWGIERSFTLDEYAHVIIDLKQKIKGNFSLVSKDAQKVVVHTTSCPFDTFVRRSPSLCFMTSSVFGGIAARNFGYAKVILHKRIALGDPGCYVTVYLQRIPEAEAAIGKEYAPDQEQASPDIAEQLRLMDSVRRLRMQLGETTARWEEVVQNAAEAICLLSTTNVFTFANGQWRTVIGAESEELIGHTFLNIVHPADQATCTAILANVLQGTRVIGHTCRIRHRNETWRTVTISLSAIRNEHGIIHGVLGIVRDVTLEREVQRLKDDLLSTTSHEFRTPLTTIRGMTEVLLRALETQHAFTPEQLAQRLQTIQRETDRLIHLSSDLLDASRLQNDVLPIRREMQNIVPLLADCIERQRSILGEATSHQLVLEANEPIVPVYVDRRRIEQVLNNLLDNAVKYSPVGGTITLSVELNNEWVYLRVADQGIGVPEVDLTKLFTPFFRASNVSSQNFMGMGIGLYLTKAIVDAHGGALTVESWEGVGTTFSMRLPLSRGKQE